jgi:putative hemolysin
MVRNVFHLDDRQLSSMMLPRVDIEWLDAASTVSQCLRKASAQGSSGIHSWYPVCRGSLDDVVGIVSMATLLQRGERYPYGIGALVEPAVFVPETLSGMELIEQFRIKSARMVFVVDEYGVVQGLLTPHDVLEAITGELKPDAQTTAWATQEADGSWLLDGLMPVGELKARLAIDEELPQEDRGRYNTLAGLLMVVCGNLPAQGERIVCAQWEFEIIALKAAASTKCVRDICRTRHLRTSRNAVGQQADPFVQQQLPFFNPVAHGVVGPVGACSGAVVHGVSHNVPSRFLKCGHGARHVPSGRHQ